MSKKADIILAEALVEKALINKEGLEPLLKETETSGQSLLQLLLIFYLKPGNTDWL